MRTNGSEITGNDPADTSDAITPDFVQDWMQHLIGRYGTAARRRRALLQPRQRADAVGRHASRRAPAAAQLRRAARPHPRLRRGDQGDRSDARETLGPAEWGWTGYFWSALDAAPGGAWWNNPQDRLAHGNVPLVAWYLQQLRAYEQQHGVRILDYLDLHYYPQASGVSLSRRRQRHHAGAAPALDALAVGSDLRRRELDRRAGAADPAHARLGDAATIPGTKLAISEYNWGALDHINGALAQADVLGIFGREGLDLATLWDPPTAAQPGAFAFRMYRNYDGAGSGFGDVGVDRRPRPTRRPSPSTPRSAPPTAR